MCHATQSVGFNTCASNPTCSIKCSATRRDSLSGTNVRTQTNTRFEMPSQHLCLLQFDRGHSNASPPDPQKYSSRDAPARGGYGSGATGGSSDYVRSGSGGSGDYVQSAQSRTNQYQSRYAVSTGRYCHRAVTLLFVS